jgi:hypothetical protein
MLDLDKFEGHTPGPWSSFAPDDVGQKFSVERLGSNHFVKSRKIATAHHDKGNGEANARLIAAAPELLEMARKLQAENDRLREAAKPIADFITAFDAKPLRQVVDEFYGIHAGSEWEASIRLSHFRALKKAMEPSNA